MKTTRFTAFLSPAGQQEVLERISDCKTSVAFKRTAKAIQLQAKVVVVRPSDGATLLKFPGLAWPISVSHEHVIRN